MSVSFEEIGQTVATFQLESGLAVGQVCKITANGKAGACGEGDDFCGVILSKNGDYGAVAKASTGGRSLLAVSVENGTVTVLL